MCFWKKKKDTEKQTSGGGLFFFKPKTKSFSFPKVPAVMDDFNALPESKMDDPFAVAALTALALCVYRNSKDLCFAILDILKAPQPLTPREKQFIADRFQDGKDYKAYSYFKGADPANDYTPVSPLAIEVKDSKNSYATEGYAELYLTSSGADAPRPVRLRKRSDGTWALWDQFLLADIRAPRKDNPWA
jgi:hypothetical protein